jgi:hypothetical protein
MKLSYHIAASDTASHALMEYMELKLHAVPQGHVNHLTALGVKYAQTLPVFVLVPPYKGYWSNFRPLLLFYHLHKGEAVAIGSLLGYIS